MSFGAHIGQLRQETGTSYFLNESFTPPSVGYRHVRPVRQLGVNPSKTAGQKHKKHPRFQVEIGGISFNLFPQIAGDFAFLPYAATLCGTQRTENRRFKIAFRLFPLNSRKLSPVCSSLQQFAPVRPIYAQSQKLPQIHGANWATDFRAGTGRFRGPQ